MRTQNSKLKIIGVQKHIKLASQTIEKVFHLVHYVTKPKTLKCVLLKIIVEGHCWHSQLSSVWREGIHYHQLKASIVKLPPHPSKKTIIQTYGERGVERI